MSWLSNVLHDVENAFLGFFRGLPADGKSLLAYLEPVFQSEEATALKELVAIGEPIVVALESTGKITNEQRNTAVSQLEAAAEAAGISAGEQLLSNAIAFIVAKLQASSPAPAAGVAAGTAGGAGVSVEGGASGPLPPAAAAGQ